MACWMYEGMILFAVVFVAGYLFGTLSQTKHALNNRHFLQAFVFIVFGVYFAWFWSMGQTIAQKTWRIQVVDRFGKRVSQGRAFVRYVLSWVWVMPPLLLASAMQLAVAELAVLMVGWVLIWGILSRFAPQGQFWHDIVAGTRLIDASPTEPFSKLAT